MWSPSRSPSMPSPDRALPGRAEPMPIPARHFVNGAPLAPPWPEGTMTAIFALGCFWGGEKAFWTLPPPAGARRRGAAGPPRAAPQARLHDAGYGRITTESREAPAFSYAEDYHQQ